MRRLPLQRRAGSIRLARLVAVSLAGAGVVAADQILQTYADSLTVYQAGKTKVQDARPRTEQRGVNLDGSTRRSSTHPMAIAGNPFESVWLGDAELAEVRLDTGTWSPTEVDIALPAIVPWVIGRSYNARQENSGQYDSNGYQGYNWFQTSQPEIVLYDDSDNTKDVLYLVYGADRYVEFNRTGSSSDTYKSKNGAAGVFVRTSGPPETWTLTDQVGTQYRFFGSDTTSHRADWQLWTITNAAGDVAYVGSTNATDAMGTDSNKRGWDADGRILKAVDSSNRRYSYTYSDDAGSTLRLTSVKAETKTGGSWEAGTASGVAEVAKVDYTYYGNDSNGDTGDIKLVTLAVPLSDNGVTVPQRKYYRYYEGSYNAVDNPGYPHQLKLMLEYEGARRFDYSDTNFDDSYVGSSDATLKFYAAVYLEYDTSHRISTAFFNGQCGCGSGSSNGIHTFTYHSSGYTNTSAYDTAWARRTVLSRPDGSFLTQYFDEIGQSLSSIISSSNPATGSPTYWPTKVIRDSAGCVTEIWTPESIASYSHNDGSANPTGTFSADSAGLMRKYVRVGSGDATGFLADRKWRDVANSDENFERSWTWDVASSTQSFGGVTQVRPLVASDRVYSEVQTSGTAGSYLTSYAYSTYSSSGQGLAVKKVTETTPTVSTGNNGSNTTHCIYTQYRRDGRLEFRSELESSGGRKFVQQRTYTSNGQLDTFYDDAVVTSVEAGSDADFESDSGAMDDDTAHTYDAQGRLVDKTTRDDRLTERYYTHLADRRIVTLQFTDKGSYYGPVGVTVTNHACMTEAQGTIALVDNPTADEPSNAIVETQPDIVSALQEEYGAMAALETMDYDNSGTRLAQHNSYFALSGLASLPGSDGTHYDPTVYRHDEMGRRDRIKEPHGTITRLVYDARGNVIERWIGTNDNGLPGGETTGTNNMVKVEETVYDSNAYITKVTRFVLDSATGKRETSYTNDVRGRAVIVEEPLAPHTLNKFDNMGRLTASAEFSSTTGLTLTSNPVQSGTMSNRLSAEEGKYDERGRVWQSLRYNIDATDGSPDDSLAADYWYSEDGKLWKRDGQELEKFAYDRLARRTHQFVLANVTDSGYSDADDLAADVVLEEYQTTYDTLGRVSMQATISRFHDDIGGSKTTGALDTNADGDKDLYTASNVKGRIQITAFWYDFLGRLTDRVEFGTYGGASFDREPSSPLDPPDRLDDEDHGLRTTYTYNSAGDVEQVEDPKGILTQYEYDALNRKITQVNNYINGTPSGETGADDNYTRYEYVDGLITKMWVDLNGNGVEDTASNPKDQVTSYSYGTTKGTGVGDSKIATGHLMRRVQYPESSDSTNDIVAFAYNAQNQDTWKRDQATSGNNSDYNIIETAYDTLGRQTSRAVSQKRSACDGAVLRIETAYDSLGRIQTATQYDAASSGNVVDQVKYIYDGWGNLTNLRQDHDSVVGSTGYYEVSYGYAKATTGRNTIRRTQISVPDDISTPSNATYSYSYRSSGGLLDADASRVTRLTDDAGTPLVTYDYLGVGQVVRTYLEEPDVMWKISGSTSGTYPDLDRFDRVTTSKWTKDLATDVNFYNVTLTYDRNSTITHWDDSIHTGTASNDNAHDVKYTVDGLNRLTRAHEGHLSGTSIATQSRDEQWELTQTGNWAVAKLNLNNDSDFVDTGERNDSRTHNQVNELTARDTDSNGTNNYSLTYDAAGNMTDDGEAYKYVYDAFGRLRQVAFRSNDATIEEFWYNGLGNRIRWHYDNSNPAGLTGADKTYRFVYDERWRIVATFRDSDTDAKEQFVYHCAGDGGYGDASYVDLVAFRNKDANTGWTAMGDGTLEERVYYCQNWRADATAIVSSAGAMKEWVKYSAYGLPLGMPVGDTDSDGDCDALADDGQVYTWATSGPYDVRGDTDLDGDVDSTDVSAVSGGHQTLGRGILSAFGVRNRKGYAGYEFDVALGDKYGVRRRSLSSVLGRWISRDPAAENDAYLYEYAYDAPVMWIDPSGEQNITPGQSGLYGIAKKIQRAATTVAKYTPGSVKEAKERAYARGRKYQNEDGSNAGAADVNFMRHCVAACSFCKEYGATATRVGAWWNEAKEGRTEKDDDRDAFCNEEGIKCCEQQGNCDVCCGLRLLWGGACVSAAMAPRESVLGAYGLSNFGR